MEGEGVSDEPIELQIKAAILEALSVDPGMGGAPEPVWETYKPEGVAIVLTNAVMPLVNAWAEGLCSHAAAAAAQEAAELIEAMEEPTA